MIQESWLLDVMLEEAPLQEDVAIFSETSTASRIVLIKQGDVGHAAMPVCEEKGSIFWAASDEWFVPQGDPA